MKSRISIVVPVGNIVSNYSYISKWLPHVPEDYQLIFAANFSDANNNESLKKLIVSASSNINFIEGDFCGPADTRNACFDYIRATRLAFWDADDQPDLKNFERMLERSLLLDSDCIIGGYSKFYLRSQKSKLVIPTKHEIIPQIAAELGLWRMVFKTENVINERFPNLILAEDQLFFSELVNSFRTLEFFPQSVYTYNVGVPNQITSQVNNVKNLGLAIDHVLTLILKSNQKQKTYLSLVLIKLILSLVKRNKTSLVTQDFWKMLPKLLFNGVFLKHKGLIPLVWHSLRIR